MQFVLPHIHHPWQCCKFQQIKKTSNFEPQNYLINGMDAPTLNGIETCQSGVVNQPLKQIGASDMKITTLGIDLAKNVF